MATLRLVALTASLIYPLNGMNRFISQLTNQLLSPTALAVGALFLGGGNLVDYRACGIIQVSTLEAEERKKNGEKI